MKNNKLNRMVAINEASIVDDIVSVSQLDINAVKHMVKSIYDEINNLMIEKKGIRIRGVGLLLIRKTYNGEWAGFLQKKPAAKSDGEYIKHSDFIKLLADKYSICDDPILTYTSVWDLLCNVIKARLDLGFNVAIRDIGTLQHRGARSTAYKWVISPLTQARIEQHIFGNSLISVD